MVTMGELARFKEVKVYHHAEVIEGEESSDDRSHVRARNAQAFRKYIEDPERKNRTTFDTG